MYYQNRTCTIIPNNTVTKGNLEGTDCIEYIQHLYHPSVQSVNRKKLQHNTSYHTL